MSQGTNLGSQKGRWIMLAALVAVLGALLFLLPGGLVQAQNDVYIDAYPENSKEPVATLTATDPESVRTIVWEVVPDGATDDIDGVAPADAADAADFMISPNGVLTFAIGDDKDPPDYEAPADAGPNNNYKVTVKATDGGTMDTISYFKVTVNVIDVEENGKITATVAPDGAEALTPPRLLLQFQPGAVLTPTLADSDAVTADSTTWKWYRASSKTAEGTLIASTPTYTVTDSPNGGDVGQYLKVMATYTDRRGGGKTAMFAFPNPVQESRDVNRDPEFPSTVADRNVPENTKRGVNIGARVTATDPDNDTLTYFVPAVSVFSINAATGQLMTKGALNYEVLTTDPIGTIPVSVTVIDSSGVFDTIAVTVNVTDVDEAPYFTATDTTPEGTSPTETQGAVRREVAENTASLGDDNVNTYTATDPEGGMVTLSLSGDDMSMFELVGVVDDNVLAFKMGMEPDFETRSDRNKDNIYEVTVVATAGGKTAERDVTVKVTNAEEAGKVTLSGAGAQPRVGSEIKATLADSDGGVENVTWLWERGTVDADNGTFTADTEDIVEGVVDAQDGIVDEKTDTYMVTDDDLNKNLRATATYLDKTYAALDADLTIAGIAEADEDGRFSNMAASMASAIVGADPTNKPPKFAEGAMTSRYVAENTMAADSPDDDAEETDNDADNVGAAVMAMDALTQSITYSLEGQGRAMFRVRPDTGQIEVGASAMLDHDKKNTYTVRVKATDSSGLANDNASITVTIHVSNVDEGPSVTGPTNVSYAENRKDTVATYRATDPERATTTVWMLLESPDSFEVDGITLTITDVADYMHFEITPDGMLKFAIGDDKDPPDYEMPRGTADPDPTDSDNTYRVVVQANDGGTGMPFGHHKVTINVSDVEEDGKITATVAPLGGTALPTLLQFQPRAVLVATLTDSDGVTVDPTTWKWYRGNSAITGATENSYTVQEDDEGHRLRVMATYTDRRGSKTATFTFPNPVQESRDDNVDPAFPSANAERDVPENTKRGVNIGARVTATDPDNDILTYSVPPAANFSINAGTGQLMTKNPLNHETDATTGVVSGTAMVMVTVTDSSGDSDIIDVTVNVTDVDEAPYFTATGTTPEGTSPTETQGAVRREVAENTASLVADTQTPYTATDPEGGMVTLSLSGDDMSMFELGGDDDNVLAFKMGMEPDFETRSDRNKDNIYEVTVVATAGGKTAERDVTVKVTNVEEAGKVTLSGAGAQPRVGSEIKATLADSDGGVENVIWMWERGTAPSGEFAPSTDDDAQDGIEDEKADTYMVMADDVGMVLRATATYLDKTYALEDADLTIAGIVSDDEDGRFSNTAESMASATVGEDPTNKPPKFNEGAMTSRYVMENVDPDTAIGAAVLAMDTQTEAAQIVYSLGGADKDSFTIEAVDAATDGTIEAKVGGQIRTKAMLDYDEMKSAYTVTVTATDSSGLANDNASITVTIHVTDVDEAPVISKSGLAVSGPGSPTFPENDGTSAFATYTAVGPDAATARLRLGGTDAGDFRLSSGDLSFRSSPDYENPADSDRNNTYSVTINANDGTYTVMKEVTVTVTNVDELGRLSGGSSHSYEENGEGAVGTYTADGATWSLEGTDRRYFTITDGMLEFKNSPNYEMPRRQALSDTNTNIYMVTVKAEAGGEMEMLEVTVTVTNEDEPGTVTLEPMRPSIGTDIEATLTDLDNVTEGTVMWQWSKSMTMDGNETVIADATSMSYTPVAGDATYYLMVKVMYTDGHGPRKEGMATTSNMVVAGDPLLIRYDANRDGEISLEEARTAVLDYFDDVITLEEARAIVLLYFN